MENLQSFQELNAFIADAYQGRRVKVLPFCYPVDIGAVAAATGAFTQSTQKINGNADFILCDLEHTCITPEILTLQINDATSQENLFNTPAAFSTVANFFGRQGNYASLGGFRRLSANSNQVITLTALNAAGATAFVLNLNGVQVFTY